MSEGLNEAIRFLRWLRPAGPWTLTAIPVDGGKTTTDTFYDASAARGWIEQRTGKQNLYVMVNPASTTLRSKARKEEVEALALLHVDLDVKTGDLETGLDAIRHRLAAFRPEPSGVIFSGGGYWAFFRLKDPLPLGGGPAQIAEAEAYNRGLERELGGDDCHNVDRICRLPGTINIPDAKKRKRGRTEALATIVRLEEHAYDLAEFTPATEHRRGGGASAVELPTELPSVDLDALPAAVLQRTRMLIVQGDDPDDATRYKSKSEVVWAVTCELVRAGCDDPTIAGILLDPDFGISDHPLRQKRSREYVERQIGRAREDNDAGGRRVLDATDPYGTAARLRDELCPNAIHTNGDYLEWTGGAYRAVEDATVTATLWRELDASVVRVKRDEVFVFERFKPSKAKVTEVEAALRGLIHEPADAIAPPAWLDCPGPPPLEIVACSNGLLHVPTGELLPPTPSFFTRNALDIAYDPDAPEPRHFKAFIEQVFPDRTAAELLQDWFGYLLLPDTSRQKILLMVGPTRSGKGVTQQIITRLVGEGNTCNPKSGSLGSDNVGALQPLIGKTVAFISDARFGRNMSAIAETLLTISGGDNVTIDRKFKEAWTGRLPTRFVMLSNEMPSLKDNSPALANRFVPLLFQQSFLGREDHGLAERIIASELPGVMNWALVGWRRLRERARFVLPRVSADAIDQILELGSPAAHFLRDCCVIEVGREVEKDRLFGSYVSWCARNEMHHSDLAHFARDLVAASNNQVRPKRASIAGQRINVFEGVDLLSTSEPY
jgi:P4 family phage/plasmid primase-like protien